MTSTDRRGQTLRKRLSFGLTALATIAFGCSDRSPTSPAKAASAARSEIVQAPIVRADPRPRNPRVLSPRGDKRLPPGVWGSDQASVTIQEGSATMKILAQALPGSGCFGSYGDIAQGIPYGPFTVAGTYTQLTGVYPGRREYPARFSGLVEGTRMTVTIAVADVSLFLGPFVLTDGVTNSWGPCLYP